MRRAAPSRAADIPRRIGLRRIRLASGLILFTYVGTHLVNHALGNASLGAMDTGLVVQKFIWQGLLGTAALYGAFATHFLLGLWALYQRRHFGWRRGEIVQLVLGLAIPPLLAHHLIVTRVAYTGFGIDKGYPQELYSFWVASPRWGVVQVCLLTVAWIHGCLGIYYWLRLKRAFTACAPVLLSVAVLVPVLALLGFVEGGRMVAAAATHAAWRHVALVPAHVGTAAENAWFAELHGRVLLALAATLALVLTARAARSLAERMHGSIRVIYPDARVVRVPRGFSVLEASLMAEVPHASVCGGRARCSTCRVRVIGDKARLPPPREVEQAVLDRIGAEPFVRLACQLRPQSDLAVVPLMPPRMSAADLRREAVSHASEERFVVILVADMRDSTRLAARRLSFDAVFAVSSFVDAVGRAVAGAGGQPNQFIGDGLLALFGVDCGPQEACRRALRAVAGIAENVAALNKVFRLEWAEPIRFGIGIHGGPAIVGRVGYGRNQVFTALGNPPNIASLLQHQCKPLACEVVVSDEVCRQSALFLRGLPRHQVTLRGHEAPLAVRSIARAIDLAPRLDPVVARYVARRMAARERNRPQA